MSDLTYPLVDFPVYGLDESWSGPRWLSHLEGAGGRPLDGVHLSHGVQPDLAAHPGPWARVITSPRRRWWAPRSEAELLGDVAFFAWMSRDGSTNDHLDAAREDAARYEEWDTADLLVDGAPSTVTLVPDHGAARQAWAGFVVVRDGFVVVTARGMQPSEVGLVDVGDGAAWHVDLGQTLRFPTSITTSREAALGHVG